MASIDDIKTAVTSQLGAGGALRSMKAQVSIT
jgi:hypothetical protein